MAGANNLMAGRIAGSFIFDWIKSGGIQLVKMHSFSGKELPRDGSSGFGRISKAVSATAKVAPDSTGDRTCVSI